MKHFTLYGLVLITIAALTIYADEKAATSSSQSGTTTPSLADGAHPLPFRAGDALEIVPFPDTAAFPAGFYPIDGDGFVDFPIIGYTRVTDKSPETLAKMLSEKYVEFMRYPHVRIRPMIRVALNGGFYRPGLYWIDPHATLWKTVQTAGGPQRTDGFKKMKWERDNIIVNDNLAPLLQDGRSLYQIGFKTGDQITVTQKPQRTGWEVFRTEALPLITFSITTATSVLSVIAMIQFYQQR